ncbi:MAG: ATP-binding cassette domain-containing protein [Lachnospiraceae bacterium]|nr:ATP-binding cassette domain-containing protein [Lachnospiraceae bacterium]
MLEVKDLCKVYKPKKGVPVQALDHVSIKFPDTGMVFLLGKSGSGKSTLLNLLGGLDRYSSGDIVIAGTSTKEFSQSDFDSYRNTYVGFIFQEYNILKEFSVGANIALAIELQGRKAEDEEINAILKEVDLEGYGDRKPNELSGGQLQRVAIARALVKNPRIIMADEPTGALDSNTGKQVFDTLKRLSKERLVIIVSHDREFSERYADRIIELADGKIVSDVEWDQEGGEETAEFRTADTEIVFEENAIRIPSRYQLTEADRIAINEYLLALSQNEAVVSVKTSKGHNKRFRATDESRIVNRLSEQFSMIKSKLPMKKAFAMGASSLKYKKLRLFFTILLSVVSFTLFAFADTCGSFNFEQSLMDSLQDSEVKYAAFEKVVRQNMDWGDGEDHFYWSPVGFSEEDVAEIEKDTGLSMIKVNRFSGDMSIGFSEQLAEHETEVYNWFAQELTDPSFQGYTVTTEQELSVMNYSLAAGALPKAGTQDAAISKYHADILLKYGMLQDGTEVSVKSYEDLLGKKLELSNMTFTICGVVDTNLDIERYEELLTRDVDTLSTVESLTAYAMSEELSYAKNYSLATVLFVGDTDAVPFHGLPASTSLNGDLVLTDDFWFGSEFLTLGAVKNVEGVEIAWLDGEKQELAENEIIVWSELLQEKFNVVTGDSQDQPMTEEDYADYQDSVIEEYIEGVKSGAYPDDLQLYGYFWNGNGEEVENYDMKIVGVINSERYYANGTSVIPDELFTRLCGEPDNGIYDFVVTAMPEDTRDLKELVSYVNYYDRDEDHAYGLVNSAVYELEIVDSTLTVVSKVFFWIGFAFAIFAILLFSNFIGTSIVHKKQEIGILRAIGSRSNDVYRIFFSESFIIASVNLVLGTILTALGVYALNRILRYDTGILITVLHFGVRQVLLLLAVSMGTAVVASFLPVKRIASKAPVDAIRNR